MDEIDAVLSRKDMTFEEAVDYFKERVPVSPAKFKELCGKYKSLAFTVSGYTSAQILNRFYEEILAALEEGNTLSEFKANMNEFLESEGYEGITPFQADNIFRTNTQTAYNVGHYEQMTDPDVLQYRPYWVYRAVGDERTRLSHLAMDGRVFAADDPIWDTWFPPNGYRCRCTVSSLSARQVEERGLTVETKMPQEVMPDPSFATNPAKDRFEPDMTGYPEALVKAYQDREKDNKPP
ncbi:MAG: phage head morphogenesis protein [Oscillospiraceae bacterium]|nr:phage head morphogenesis protein [Oscillospiraceae bacterium]